MYINERTLEVLTSGVIPKEVDWIGVPDETELIYYFDGSDPIGDECVLFYKKDLTATWCLCKDVGYWSDNVKAKYPTYNEIKEFVTTYGKLIWCKEQFKQMNEAISDEGVFASMKESEKIDKEKNTLAPIKSDGGSSGYYFTKLPKYLIDQIVETGGIEIKDIVRYCFDNDADCKDIIKALKRINESKKGGGKDGITIDYDLKKIGFFYNEMVNAYLKTKEENVK